MVKKYLFYADKSPLFLLNCFSLEKSKKGIELFKENKKNIKSGSFNCLFLLTKMS